MNTQNHTFTAMADAARKLNDEDYLLEDRDVFETRIAFLPYAEKQAERQRRLDAQQRPMSPPHWSDDPRFESKEHYDAVMAGDVKLDGPESVRRNPHIKRSEVSAFYSQDGFSTNRDPSGVRNDL